MKSSMSYSRHQLSGEASFVCSKLALFITGQNSTGTLRHQSELAGQTGHLKNEVGHLKEFLLKKKTINPMHIIQQMTNLAGQI